MKLIFNAAGWLLFAIERLAVRGQAWIDDHYPALDDARVDKALDDIADYLSGTLDQSRVDRYIDSHRIGMPPRGRR